MKYLFVLLLLVPLAGCQPNLSNLPAYTENKQLQAIIETPAGAGYQNKYNPETNAFETVQEAGQDKAIRFLPYPVNAGFIPSTMPPKGTGSKENQLPVFIIASSQEPGTVLEIMPLGVLILEINGELTYQLVATPAKPSERLLSATSFEEFNQENPAVKKILETWFVNYDPAKKARIMAWKDDRFADELVRKWLL